LPDCKGARERVTGTPSKSEEWEAAAVEARSSNSVVRKRPQEIALANAMMEE
jgi:hypothetical protein